MSAERVDYYSEEEYQHRIQEEERQEEERQEEEYQKRRYEERQEEERQEEERQEEERQEEDTQGEIECLKDTECENHKTNRESELLSLVDGALEIVAIFKAESPSQKVWQKEWIRKAQSLGASFE